MTWRLRCWGGVGAGYIETVQTAIRNNFWRTPSWLESLMDNRPTYFWATPNKKQLPPFLESRLQTRLLEKKPEYLKYDFKTVPGDPRWYLHPVDAFVKRQLFHIKKGCSEEIAFEKVEQELLEASAQQVLEIELAKQQAEDFCIPDKTEHKFAQKVIAYKRAAIRFREDERRERREKLEQILAYKKEAGDKTLITLDSLTLDGLLAGDVVDYLKLYPADTELFHHKVLTDALAAQEDDNIRIDDDSANYSIDENNLFVQNPSDDILKEEVKVDLPPSYAEEIEAYDKGLNPILEKELHLYLNQYQVANYIKDYINPLSDVDNNLRKEDY